MLIEELRGWKETEAMSDDGRRKLFLMRKAADRTEELEAALRNIVSAYDDIDPVIRMRAAVDAARALVK